MKYTIGCDPEIFLMQDGKYISAIGKIGGSKLMPRPIDMVGHMVLEDNVAVEFNIPPAEDYQNFRKSIQHVMKHLKKELPGYEFSQESAVSFEPDQLEDPMAQEFGCDPDYNAWTKDVNPKPCADDRSLRSCGGHIHVGFDRLDPIQVVRSMDLHLGVPSIKLDKGDLRRKLYGNAGAYREKPYGVEYRTLSNFWIFNSKLIKWVYEQTGKALEFVERGNILTEEHGELIQSCINQGNMESYDRLRATYGL